MNLEWVTVGDKSVCEDCQKRDGQQHTVEEWDELGLPREGATLCGDNCRCSLFPTSLKDIVVEVPTEWEGRSVKDITDEVFSDLIGRIKFDKKYGKSLLIDKFKSVAGIGSISYQQAAKLSAKFDYMMELIYRYQMEIGDLPDEYYGVQEINQKISWLKGRLKL